MTSQRIESMEALGRHDNGCKKGLVLEAFVGVEVLEVELLVLRVIWVLNTELSLKLLKSEM